MDDFPFNTVSLNPDTIERYSESYKAIKAKFDIQFTGNINFQLEQFEVFKPYLDTAIKGSLVIKQENNCDSYVLFVETHTRAKEAKGLPADRYGYQTWAIAFLKRDFGRVLVRRETIADKIIELVHPVELDFDDDKAFSDTFFVLVNDRAKAIAAIDRNFRNAVMDIRKDDFVIEIVEHTLIAGCTQPMSPGRAVYLAEFIARVATLC